MLFYAHFVSIAGIHMNTIHLDNGRMGFIMRWHQMSAPDVLQKLGVSAAGLDDRQAEARRRQYGANKLREEPKQGKIRRFFAQFSDFMVLILLGAAAVSFLTALLTGEGDFADPVIILLIVVTDAVIGTVQEGRAEQAIAALQKLSAPMCRVRRNGHTVLIPAVEVTVGDIAELSEGDCVPADGRLLDGTGLQMDEAPLTGESFPVEKDSRRRLPENAPLSEQQNMVFAGTSVAAGHGVAVITAVGMQTEMGKIAELLVRESAPQTPLQLRLAKTGKMLGIAAMGICAVIFLLGCLQRIPAAEMFLIAVSLAVAAIPEGLPAVVTIVLALGVRRIAAQRAIVRRLPAVETLGCATVICSDKTGTLTQNKMTVSRLSDGRKTVTPESTEGQAMLTCGVLCSNGESDPTEAAILRAAAAQGISLRDLGRSYPRTGEIPFSGEKKYMVTVHRDGGGWRIVVKGAPEVVLGRCTVPQDDFTRRQVQQEIRYLSGQGLRVLAVAQRVVTNLPAEAHWAEELCFVGLMGLMDPPRPEVRAAVQQCRSAGIRPVMITGDHALTAAAIAGELGIRQEGLDLLAAIFVVLHDLHIDAASAQGGSQIIADPARTAENAGTDTAGSNVQTLDQGGQISGGSGDEDPVTLLEGEIA